MVFKTIGAIIIILLMVFSSVWLVKGIAYSLKVQKDVMGNEMTCYFDRGFVRTPFVRICRGNDSLTFTKKEIFEE